MSQLEVLLLARARVRHHQQSHCVSLASVPFVSFALPSHAAVAAACDLRCVYTLVRLTAHFRCLIPPGRVVVVVVIVVAAAAAAVVVVLLLLLLLCRYGTVRSFNLEHHTILQVLQYWRCLLYQYARTALARTAVVLPTITTASGVEHVTVLAVCQLQPSTSERDLGRAQRGLRFCCCCKD